MAMQDDVGRRDHVLASSNWNTQWWDREYALGMLKELHALLESAPKDARLECHRGINAEGYEVLWLTVPHTGDAVLTSHEFNQSHPCPPLC